ncbi:MAG: prepilin-type N-terminal cleavage/methylation domain-containing protein [Candidatus Riflebacteria bacterium]|nr:prepilin-type N-terminal cleavage/methylation domain-containing protein [Candidatus Riflebacteria bacterium]
MKKNKKAFTLVEILICILIASLIMVGLMNLFQVGIKGSSKGLAHLENMETAFILMSQIEYDLLRAYNITDPQNGSEDNGAKWDFWYGNSDSNKASVDYSYENNAIARKVTLYNLNGSIGGNEKTYFCKGYNVDLKFLHLVFEVGSSDFSKKRHGMWVELTVSSKDNRNGGNNEPFTLKRLIIVHKKQ